MISLTIWLYLLASIFVLAPPSWDINQIRSRENLSLITSHQLNINPEMLNTRRKIETNRTATAINNNQSDLNSYRSSWRFISKTTVRVRFRLSEFLLRSVISTRFLVRHINTGYIETHDKPDEIINSSITLYLHNIKHGRHTVCLLLYSSRLMRNPKHILCQDIIFNFHKYGHLDTDSDEYGNTFVFLLTQYAIVCGILCILQLTHAARKRRFLGALYDKANALRQTMMEYHHRPQENKSTPDLYHRSQTLEYLIYNLNRNALSNLDKMHMEPAHDDNINLINRSPASDHQRKVYKKYLKIPNRSRTIAANTNLELHEDKNNIVYSDESDFDTRSYEEQSASYKSVSHILEANKPWITRLTDDGSIKHAILPPESLHNTQIQNL